MRKETWTEPVKRKCVVTSKTTGYVKLRLTVGDIPGYKQEVRTY